MSFVKTAVYAKNVPGWERAVRIVASLAMVGAAFALVPAPWSWALAGSAIVFSLTGLVGFCPACALVGRRLERGG